MLMTFLMLKQYIRSQCGLWCLNLFEVLGMEKNERTLVGVVQNLRQVDRFLSWISKFSNAAKAWYWAAFFQNLSSFGKFSITDKICVRTLLHFITFLYLPADMQISCTTWLQNPKTASGDGTFEGDARCHRIQQPFECCSEKLGFAQMWVLLVAFK